MSLMKELIVPTQFRGILLKSQRNMCTICIYTFSTFFSFFQFPSKRLLLNSPRNDKSRSHFHFAQCWSAQARFLYRKTSQDKLEAITELEGKKKKKQYLKLEKMGMNCGPCVKRNTILLTCTTSNEWKTQLSSYKSLFVKLIHSYRTK